MNQRTILSLPAIASAVLLLLAAPAAVQAQFGYMANADDTNTITITNYTGSGGAVTIPTSIDGLTVTGIGEHTFYGNPSLTSITIPGSVTCIGEELFTFCTGLTNVFLPNGLTGIGQDAFFACNGLASITIPASVTNIGDYAFERCINLASIYFQSNAPTIGRAVFSADNHDHGVTAYYLPGTSGWNNYFSGGLAVLWNPFIQANGANFGVSDNQFGFNIIGTNNFTVVVETSTNLDSRVWTPLQTVTLTNGSFYFSDPPMDQLSQALLRSRLALSGSDQDVAKLSNILVSCGFLCFDGGVPRKNA